MVLIVCQGAQSFTMFEEKVAVSPILALHGYVINPIVPDATHVLFKRLICTEKLLIWDLVVCVIAE